MANENILTDIERTLKESLETAISLHGESLPVRIVLPDPDFVEMEYPCLTLQLTDIRQDFSRQDNERQVEKDLATMTARVMDKTRPYNLYYTLAVHAQKLRDERLLLGALLDYLDTHSVMLSTVFNKTFYLHRDLAYRELTVSGKSVKAVGLIIKTRLDPQEEKAVPLVQEMKVSAQVNRKEE